MLTLCTIAAEVAACRKCPLYKHALHGVPGEGPETASIMLVGQAPGRMEDKTGKPFMGLAGQFLTAQLQQLGIKRQDVFITSVVKHYPPENRMPTKTEIAACLPYLIEQVHHINPKVVVLMGKIAQALRTHPAMRGRVIVEVPHPAAARRFPEQRRIFQKKIKQLAKYCPP
ncbi:uracil-DNA glycosylase [Candidatus Woesearchaeota archaeon]|nr:uracil-DNA glycosylase [Candidatus Woesearchaeota archaeon]